MENLRTVEIWLDDQFIETEFEQPDEWNEDRFFQEVVDYILSNISIKIL